MEAWKMLFLVRRVLPIGLILGAAASFAAPADSRLADAAMRGDKEAVTTLLSDRSNINAPQNDGTTALHWAVRKGDLATVQALIKAGADVKVANRYGVTPISIAAIDGNPRRGSKFRECRRRNRLDDRCPYRQDRGRKTAARTRRRCQRQRF
jgi:hypothetical protein